MNNASPDRTVRTAWTMVKVVTLAAGVAVIGIVALYFVEEWRAEKAWQRYRADAASRGAKLDLSDFQRTPIPDAQNIAMAPVFRDDPSARDPKNNASAFALPKPGEDVASRPKDLRRTPLDLTNWRDRLVEEGWIPEAGPEPARDVLEALRRFDPKLKELRMALERPDCEFPVEWSKGVMATIPWVRVGSDAARLLALRARALLATGNPKAARDDVMDLLALRRALRRELGLISGLFRGSQLQLAAVVIHDGIAAHGWREEDLRDLMAELSTAEALKDSEYAIETERALVNVTFDQLCELSFAQRSRRTEEVIAPGVRISFPSGIIRQNQIKVNRAFDAALRRIDLEQAVIRAPTPEEEREMSGGTMVNRLSQIYYMLAHVSVSPLGAYENAFARNAASADLARVGCALELYRMKNGSYPERLELLLSEDLLGELPVDVWTGEPLHYAKTPDGFRLWAVGKNRKDDGGVYHSNRTRGEQLDWIFEVPRR